jgi:hypothetical protein
MYALKHVTLGPAEGQTHRTGAARLPPAPNVTFIGHPYMPLLPCFILFNKLLMGT